MVTLPMNKEATQMTDPGFVGHTELIGEVCGVSDVTIMLASDQLIVTHVSTHCSLAEAIRRATQPRIRTILKLTSDAVARLIENPRIAVAGLNPHAGENGLFGREEIDVIAPAVARAAARGIRCKGPFAADTVFLKAFAGEYDGVLSMYHDQGQIATKLKGFNRGITVTAGLETVFTTPAHGTAFDIVGQGRADTGALERAVHLGARLAAARKRSKLAATAA